ncbi:hypothetical protein C8J57DRAFT_1502225 [Mycena rebaudengoi]|nr:hypothetical protein C8J57DRAFT_1502225 [Mycena rebaudengoi]
MAKGKKKRCHCSSHCGKLLAARTRSLHYDTTSPSYQLPSSSEWEAVSEPNSKSENETESAPHIPILSTAIPHPDLMSVDTDSESECNQFSSDHEYMEVDDPHLLVTTTRRRGWRMETMSLKKKEADTEENRKIILTDNEDDSDDADADLLTLTKQNQKNLPVESKKKREGAPKADDEPPKKSKHCGSYGRQGEFVIYSCLMKLVAEVEHPQLENDELLENMLCSTICAIVSKDSALYDNGETSSYLTVDDFTRFVLVPFVTVSLIAEDLSFKDFQSALIERNVSNDFGELFHPEDDNNDIVHEIHRQNVLWIRANIGAEEEEKIQRKLKIRLPPRPSPPIQVKTVDDFPSISFLYLLIAYVNKILARKKKAAQQKMTDPESSTSKHETRSQTARSKPSAEDEAELD